ncbi:hypothetical protein PAHAL_2G111500 [Panicum hallii]|uniref:Uncharacterized protein n=1 Tax=Panicum hallii TaxID=206008 RepID=A0A2T8KNT2_9POAL|nr:hypothetical protein PAHAL_2G111500 [Panicum hallii]
MRRRRRRAARAGAGGGDGGGGGAARTARGRAFCWLPYVVRPGGRSGNAEATSAEGACGGEVKVVAPCGWAFEEEVEEARGAGGGRERRRHFWKRRTAALLRWFRPGVPVPVPCLSPVWCHASGAGSRGCRHARLVTWRHAILFLPPKCYDFTALTEQLHQKKIFKKSLQSGVKVYACFGKQ